MSVPMEKRGLSDAEFVNTAMALDVETTRFCKNKDQLPKSLTFYKGQRISALATDVSELCTLANSIYPRNAHEAQIRRDYITKAIGKLYFLANQFEVLRRLKENIDLDKVGELMDFVDDEISLLVGLKKSDEQRYKKLK